MHVLLVEDQKMFAESLARRYPQGHDVRTDRALIDYVAGLKSRFLRSAPPLAKVAWDPKLHILRNALGTHTSVSRVQGSQLKAKREILSQAAAVMRRTCRSEERRVGKECLR